MRGLRLLLLFALIVSFSASAGAQTNPISLLRSVPEAAWQLSSCLRLGALEQVDLAALVATLPKDPAIEPEILRGSLAALREAALTMSAEEIQATLANLSPKVLAGLRDQLRSKVSAESFNRMTQARPSEVERVPDPSDVALRLESPTAMQAATSTLVQIDLLLLAAVKRKTQITSELYQRIEAVLDPIDRFVERENLAELARSFEMDLEVSVDRPVGENLHSKARQLVTVRKRIAAALEREALVVSNSHSRSEPKNPFHPRIVELAAEFKVQPSTVSGLLHSNSVLHGGSNFERDLEFARSILKAGLKEKSRLASAIKADNSGVLATIVEKRSVTRLMALESEIPWGLFPGDPLPAFRWAATQTKQALAALTAVAASARPELFEPGHFSTVATVDLNINDLPHMIVKGERSLEDRIKSGPVGPSMDQVRELLDDHAGAFAGVRAPRSEIEGWFHTLDFLPDLYPGRFFHVDFAELEGSAFALNAGGNSVWLHSELLDAPAHVLVPVAAILSAYAKVLAFHGDENPVLRHAAALVNAARAFEPWAFRGEGIPEDAKSVVVNFFARDFSVPVDLRPDVVHWFRGHADLFTPGFASALADLLESGISGKPGSLQYDVDLATAIDTKGYWHFEDWGLPSITPDMSYSMRERMGPNAISLSKQSDLALSAWDYWTHQPFYASALATSLGRPPSEGSHLIELIKADRTPFDQMRLSRVVQDQVPDWVEVASMKETVRPASAAFDSPSHPQYRELLPIFRQYGRARAGTDDTSATWFDLLMYSLDPRYGPKRSLSVFSASRPTADEVQRYVEGLEVWGNPYGKDLFRLQFMKDVLDSDGVIAFLKKFSPKDAQLLMMAVDQIRMEMTKDDLKVTDQTVAVARILKNWLSHPGEPFETGVKFLGDRNQVYLSRTLEQLELHGTASGLSNYLSREEMMRVLEISGIKVDLGGAVLDKALRAGITAKRFDDEGRIAGARERLKKDSALRAAFWEGDPERPIVEWSGAALALRYIAASADPFSMQALLPRLPTLLDGIESVPGDVPMAARHELWTSILEKTIPNDPATLAETQWWSAYDQILKQVGEERQALVEFLIENRKTDTPLVHRRSLFYSYRALSKLILKLPILSLKEPGPIRDRVLENLAPLVIIGMQSDFVAGMWSLYPAQIVECFTNANVVAAAESLNLLSKSRPDLFKKILEGIRKKEEEMPPESRTDMASEIPPFMKWHELQMTKGPIRTQEVNSHQVTNSYVALGVRRSAMEEVIKSHFRFLATRLHPDKGRAFDPQKQQKLFLMVTEAYQGSELGINPEHRQKTNQLLPDGPQYYPTENIFEKLIESRR